MEYCNYYFVKMLYEVCSKFYANIDPYLGLYMLDDTLTKWFTQKIITYKMSIKPCELFCKYHNLNTADYLKWIENN